MSSAVPLLPPPLRDGDRLSREEFLRRWEAMPALKFAELIDGVVCMSSPVSLGHGEQQSILDGWLVYYVAATPGCRSVNDATWLMGPDVPQPDLALRILPDCGGQARTQDNLLAGAPELIVEVSASSKARDLGPKLHLYERAGVREYITALVKERNIIWRELVKGRFRRIEADEDGILRSRIFPGLWLDARALWNFDLARVFAVVNQGVATEEHAAFVRKLTSRTTD